MPEQAEATEVSQQIQDLRSMLISVIQDFTVLKVMIQEKGLWDEARYKKLRIQRMVDDHSSAGCDSHKSYSHYPYTISESDFLRQRLKANEVEVRSFEIQVATVQTLT